MDVILSGYNLDVETIKEAKAYLKRVVTDLNEDDPLKQELQDFLSMDHFTPETLSAAYARISRNPAPIPELRDKARKEVDKARRSNQAIIFGLGHSSVAEHAVFNFDILGVSRRLVEEIQHFRLTSFTEKSQRYILLEDDYVVPPDLRGSDFERPFILMINKQNQAYHDLLSRLKPYMFEKYEKLAREKKNHSMIEGWAKEDARYIVPLATEAQMGMTVNARTFEYMISSLAASPLPEAREFAEKAFTCVSGLAPSIVKYTEPTDYQKQMPADMSQFISGLTKDDAHSPELPPEVNLINAPGDGDLQVFEALVMEFGGYRMKDSRVFVKKMSKSDKIEMLKTLVRHLQSFNSMPRSFERIYAEFELNISASCFGQLKRHRMATQIVGPYDISLGNRLPESIYAVDMNQYFMEIVAQTNELYSKIRNSFPLAGDYILTNSHRRRVFFKANLRELYHFSRLREDAHAQWDIRQIGQQMVRNIKEVWPLTSLLFSGKDAFEETLSAFLNR